MDEPQRTGSEEASPVDDGADRRGDEKGDLKDIAALATAVLGVFTALAGGATVGGGFDRISRDYPLQVAVALFAFTVATVLAAWTTLLVRSQRSLSQETAARRPPQLLVRSALFLFVAGLGFSFWAMLGTAGNRSRPSVTLTVKSGDHDEHFLDAEIRASGLNAREYIRVKAVQVAGGRLLEDQPPIYLSTQGAKSSGEVEVRFSLPLPPGRYDAVLIKVWQTGKEPPCPLDRIGSPGTFGCVTFAVPRAP